MKTKTLQDPIVGHQELRFFPPRVARESENFEIVKNVYLLFLSTCIRLVRLFNTILAQVLIVERRKQPQPYP